MGVALVVFGGLLSPVPYDVRLKAWLCLGLLALAAETVLRIDLPQSRRQIPPAVVAPGSARAAFMFARVYGSGLFTYLPTSAPHILLIAIALVASPSEALCAAASFGAGRGLPFLVRSMAIRRDDYERALQASVGRWRSKAGVITFILIAIVALL